MELIYIDESGDNGVKNPKQFILSGISVPSEDWKKLNWKIKELKTDITKMTGKSAGELKGRYLFQHRGERFYGSHTTNDDILMIYLRAIQIICDPMIRLFVFIKSKEVFLQEHAGINIDGLDGQSESRIDKLNKNFLTESLRQYFSHYDSYLCGNSLYEGLPRNGLVYYDRNFEKYVRRTVKECTQRYDQRLEHPFAGIIENPQFLDSTTSNFIQLADIAAYSFNKIYNGYTDKDDFCIPAHIVEMLLDKNMLKHHTAPPLCVLKKDRTPS